MDSTIISLTTPLQRRFLSEVIFKFAPEVKVVDKGSSRLMKTLYYVSFMFMWNKRFLTDYITVIGSTVYVPEVRWQTMGEISRLTTLLHEGAHMYDVKKNPLWLVGYLFPQVGFLLLGVLLTLWSPWFLLLCLGVALPLPAPWRFLFEARGYRFNLMMMWIKSFTPGTQEHQDYITFIGSQLTDRWYFFAMPFKGIVEKELLKWDPEEPYTKTVMAWLEKENLV